MRDIVRYMEGTLLVEPHEYIGIPPTRCGGSAAPLLVGANVAL